MIVRTGLGLVVVEHWFDADGDQTEDEELAVLYDGRIVEGQSEGLWVSGRWVLVRPLPLN